MLRVGRISYTNDLPLYAPFDCGAVPFPATMLSAVPAKLNAMLLEGRLDVSPISAFHYLRHAERFALLPDICIGSRGDVWSVVLVSTSPPEDLGGCEIAVTGESATGRNLLRVLLERRYGVRAKLVESGDALACALALRQPALLIGDQAIDARLAVDPAHVYDLGRLWHDWTQADMVYAVWAARAETYLRRRDEVDAVVAALRSALRWSGEHESEIVRAAQAVRPRPADFYERYFATLNFTFDASARRGLERFSDELRALDGDPEVLRVAG